MVVGMIVVVGNELQAVHDGGFVIEDFVDYGFDVLAQFFHRFGLKFMYLPGFLKKAAHSLVNARGNIVAYPVRLQDPLRGLLAGNQYLDVFDIFPEFQGLDQPVVEDYSLEKEGSAEKIPYILGENLSRLEISGFNVDSYMRQKIAPPTYLKIKDNFHP
jgi:hypothetical protein